jgi:hypothetical protein
MTNTPAMTGHGTSETAPRPRTYRHRMRKKRAASQLPYSYHQAVSGADVACPTGRVGGWAATRGEEMPHDEHR